METNSNTPVIQDNSKPDFFQVVSGKYIHSGKAAHSRIPIQAVNERESRAYVAGCEHVWQNYVVHLQKEKDGLKNAYEDFTQAYQLRLAESINVWIEECKQLRSDKEELLQALKDLFLCKTIDGFIVKTNKAQELISKHESK